MLMNHQPATDFTASPGFVISLFKALPGYSLLLQNDGPRFTILASTRYYLLEPGVSETTLIGQGLFEAFPPNSAVPEDRGESDLRASLAYVLEHKRAHHLPIHRYDVRHADGSFMERHWRAENNPVFAPSGEVAYIIHTTEDVTDQVRAGRLEQKMRGLEKAEVATRRRESNLRNMIMQSPVAMCILGGEDYVIDVANERMFQLLGRGKEALLGTPFFEGVPDARNQGYEDLLRNVYITGHSFSAYGTPIELMREGSMQTIYLNLLYEPFRDEKGRITGIMVVALDVTEQELARRELERTEARSRLAVESARLGTFDINLTRQTIEYSQRTAEIFGFPLDTQVPYSVFVDAIHPDDKAIRREAHHRAKQTGQLLYEVRMLRLDGALCWIRLNGTYTSTPGGDDALIGTIMDITTERKTSELLEQKIEERTGELAKTIQELQRSNRHLEEFAHAASHDMKEPIRKVLTFSHRLKDSLGPKLTAQEEDLFLRMEKATERMGLLVDDLLEFSHVSDKSVAMEWVNLNDKLKNVLMDLELSSIEKGAEVVIRDLPTVLGYRRQLQQLFQNLVSNALKYSKPGVPPAITISSARVLGRDVIPTLEGAPADNYFHLVEVSDNGIGFEPRYAERIFTMFQRLHGKAEYEGTGVGLSIVKKVVENHNGYVLAESKLGEGSVFKVLLPIHPEQA